MSFRIFAMCTCRSAFCTGCLNNIAHVSTDKVFKVFEELLLGISQYLSIITFHLHSFHMENQVICSSYETTLHANTLHTACCRQPKVSLPYLCYDCAEMMFVSCTHITSDQSKLHKYGKLITHHAYPVISLYPMKLPGLISQKS